VTRLEKLLAGGAMNGPIHPAAAQQRRVRGVDDGIDPIRSEITLLQSQTLANEGGSIHTSAL
jgi:hypothetical protein